MLIPIFTKQFQRDLKLMKRRGKEIEHLKHIMRDLIEQNKLGSQYSDHKLVGLFKGRRECHIEFDWILIYKLDADEIIFERTGTHSDLFE